MDFSKLRAYIKFRKWGKYIITIVVFLFIFLFIGDQSMVQYARRNRDIKEYERQTHAYRQQVQQARNMLLILSNKDSLERYAREQYYMHEDNEDIYLIEQ